MKLHLAGKVVLVSGGSSNIGEAITRSFSQEGAVVYVGFATEAGELRAQAMCSSLPQCSPIRLDVTSEESVQSAHDQLMQLHGHLDVLVHNAGVFTVAAQESLSQSEWDMVFNTNIQGMWRLVRLMLDLLKRGTNPAIVATSSMNALRPGFGGTAHYDASKAAVSGYVRSLAAELAPLVRVNAVAPGLVDAPYLHGDNPLGSKYESRSVQGRMVPASEIADVVLFLASVVSAPIVGQTVVADCGYMLG